MDSKKKKYIIIASICVVLLIVIGATYAYWTTTKVQEDKNEINTTCLDVTYENLSQGITLEKTFPISDADGKATTGYKFKLTNNCDSYVAYNVNLEDLKLDTGVNKINAAYLDTILNDGPVVGLTAYPEIPTLLNDDSSEGARRLETGTLGPKDGGNDSIEYTLRMWLDKNTPDSEMSKSYKSKISVYGTVVAPENAVEKITKLANQPAAASADNTTQLVEDGTKDNNIRYVGKDPSNYVDIGNGVYQTDIWVGYNNEDIYKGQYTVEYTSEEECKGNGKYNKHCTQIHSKGDPILWRIIGVMKDNTTDDKQTTRLKIIRDEDIGMMAWDARCKSEGSDETEICSSEYDYKNNWNNANLKETLNEAFWNRGITTKRNYVYVYDDENEWNDYWFKLNFEDTGIREISKKLVDSTKWHLGGVTSDEYDTATAAIYYIKEHDSVTYEDNPQSIEAMVGLMYASDYGYATNGGEKTRDECLAKNLYDWSDSSYEDCKKNDWLFDPSDDLWLMNPYASNYGEVAYASYYGYVGTDIDVYWYGHRVRPVLYLKPNIKITSGTGTQQEPFILAE